MKMRLSRWALNPVTGVLISGDIWTQREIDIEGGPCEDMGRWWLSTCQGERPGTV